MTDLVDLSVPNPPPYRIDLFIAERSVEVQFNMLETWLEYMRTEDSYMNVFGPNGSTWRLGHDFRNELDAVSKGTVGMAMRLRLGWMDDKMFVSSVVMMLLLGMLDDVFGLYLSLKDIFNRCNLTGLVLSLKGNGRMNSRYWDLAERRSVGSFFRLERTSGK